MKFNQSEFIAPNGGIINDGMDSVGDIHNLYLARAAMLRAGFIHKTGERDNLTLLLTGERITKEQLEYCNNIVAKNIMDGHDVTISLPNGDSTTISEESNWEVAKIYGFYLKEGRFAQGGYPEYKPPKRKKKRDVLVK